ncbi:unannotated protein [freshwater metagenome]|uniref:Unannotated protein n=1 Tax=freshwater metagenome TaxID=449393 RepID=A0A6J6BHC6_9ZZZZ
MSRSLFPTGFPSTTTWPDSMSAVIAVLDIPRPLLSPASTLSPAKPSGMTSDLSSDIRVFCRAW